MGKAAIVAVVAAVVVMVVLFWWRSAAGVTASEIQAAVADAEQRLGGRVDERAAAIETRLERLERQTTAQTAQLNRIEGQLGSIEGKLDRLLKLAEPPLPDAMRRAESASRVSAEGRMAGK